MLPWTTCRPHRKIAFAKTHKTASSTVQNILLRYGLANGVEFLLPAAHNYLGNMLKPFRIENLDRDGERGLPKFLIGIVHCGASTQSSYFADPF